ncbi:MAG TPA: undecaprenyl-diphosphatase UppP [Bryobacteraceae bacterium]|jgi:undecaprenyl-diphosphatase|nr:undecaprenyl-diphosphatase UppP [Bryobacteraceae bacterium]
MPLLHAIVLGIVQGITEFLPISSTAHLIIIPWILGWDDGGLTFDIALHVGTLASVLLYFVRDWIQILAQGFGLNLGYDPVLSKNRNLLWFLVLASIPAGIIGYLFEKQAESSLRSPYVIGTTAIAVGILMWIADRSGRRHKDLGHVTVADALTIGTAQALAVIPGVSRSGITISAGLFCNLDRQTAARFSFLLLTPVTAGAAAKKLWDLMRHGGGIPADMHTAFLVGMAASAITGVLVIGFFMNYLRRRTLSFFVWYRIVFGIIVFALALFRFNGR